MKAYILSSQAIQKKAPDDSFDRFQLWFRRKNVENIAIEDRRTAQS